MNKIKKQTLFYSDGGPGKYADLYSDEHHNLLKPLKEWVTGLVTVEDYLKKPSLLNNQEVDIINITFTGAGKISYENTDFAQKCLFVTVENKNDDLRDNMVALLQEAGYRVAMKGAYLTRSRAYFLVFNDIEGPYALRALLELSGDIANENQYTSDDKYSEGGHLYKATSGKVTIKYLVRYKKKAVLITPLSPQSGVINPSNMPDGNDPKEPGDNETDEPGGANTDEPGGANIDEPTVSDTDSWQLLGLKMKKLYWVLSGFGAVVFTLVMVKLLKKGND